jgi:large subunit ribosomal protein L29
VRPSEIRDLSDAELEARTQELEEELFLLQLRRATSQLENSMKLRAVRRDVARLLTVRRERVKADRR